MSTSISSPMDKKELTNWAELPSDLISEILSRLSAFDILENAQKVCKTWHRVCKDPWIWRKIEIENRKNIARFRFWYDLESMCRHAVDRSQGGLVEIDIWYFCTDELLAYIANRSSNLRILRLRLCKQMTVLGFKEAVVKLPLLEYLEFSGLILLGKGLRVAGQSCPNLRTLKLFYKVDHSFHTFDDDALNNDAAFAIAQSMPQLRHLELFGNFITNVGLKAILDGCPHLEHLDIRECFNVDLTGDLEKLCVEKIKDFKRPNDSIDGHPYLHYYNIPCYPYYF